MSLVSGYETPWQYDSPMDSPLEELVDAAVFPTLGPHGIIIDHTFPSSAEKGVNLPFSCDVHNKGTKGQIAFGIVNAEGNPGNVVVTFQGKETIIRPAYYWRVHTVNLVPNCYHIISGGSIRFESAGNYVIKLRGMWFLNGKWYYSSAEEITKNVTVTVDGEPPTPPPNGNGWVVTKPIHVFDDEKLKAEWWDIKKEKSRTIINIDTTVLVGARLDYTVKYTQGLPIAEVANIGLDGVNIATDRLSKGESKSGSIDLTGLIGRDVTITISFKSSPGVWSEVLFDVWLNLGFSEDPKEDPKADDDDFLDKYKYWIAGGIILTVFLLTRQRGPQIIVVGGQK